MKKILLVSGCSFTDKNFISDHHPEMNTDWRKWPEILAKKLDMDLINVAKCGAGNEYIYSSLVDKIITTDNIGLIISAWSQVHRKDWKKKNKWFNNAETCNHSSFTDMEPWIDKSLRYFYSLQEVCKSKKIPYKAFCMLHPFRGYTWNKRLNKLVTENRKELLQYIHNSPYFNKIDDSFIGWPGDPDLGGFSIKGDILLGYGQESYQYAISERDNHPNAKGQLKIAEFIYEQL